MTFPAFRQFIAKPSASRVLTFISIYVVGGLEGHFYPDLYSPTGVDVDATKRVVCENTDLVRGIKAHAEIGGFERWGIEVIRLAAEAGAQRAVGQRDQAPRHRLLAHDPLGKQSGFAHPTGYELFNLTQDPYETTNIYARISASRPDLVGALVRKLRELYTCAGGEECAAAAAGGGAADGK